jgi:prepilin-type N-terminal cleavage/methylation domain-containing protein
VPSFVDMPRGPERGPDSGFSLIEVIVALGVLTIVMVTLLPQLVVGITSTGTARLVTQAKGVAQGQLERMRNLPFHIAPAAGDHRDVLDTYYRNLTAPGVTPVCTTGSGYAVPHVGWSGYVSATAERCTYEPAGAFYRKVEELPAANGIGRFTMVVDTQFLSGSTPPQPVTPREGYDTQTTGRDTPASSQIGITVTLLYADRQTLRPVTTFTQISQQPATTTRAEAEADVTTIEVSSVTSANGAVSLSSGLLHLTGSLTYASTAGASLTGTSAGLATGEQASGATATVSAPPAQAAATRTSGEGWLASTDCELACWGSTRLDVAALSAESALPNVGSQAAPMQALLTDTLRNGVSFGNSAASAYRTDLKLTPPLLRLHPDAAPTASGISPGCVPGGTGTPAYVEASAYVRTTGPDSTAVESCAVARTASLSMFPTSFAPRGLVVIELQKASARCLVQGGDHLATTASDFRAVVKYWDTRGAGPDDDGYSTAGEIVPGMSEDPLDAVPMSTVVFEGGEPTQDLLLSHYIASWSSLTDEEVARSQVGGSAEVTLPGVVRIASQPVRQGATAPDETSVVSVTLGAVSCSAADMR